MSQINITPATHATKICPRCAGTTRVRHVRRGGWIIEPCGYCDSGRVSPETADTLRQLMGYADGQAEARDAVLGPISVPCCQPMESDPCVSCVPPDLIPDEPPFEPSEENEADYRTWSRRLDDAAWARRIEAEPTFIEQLYALANELGDDLDPVRSWVGKFLVGAGADLARFLDAKDPESFETRREACLDAARDAAEARARHASQ